MRPTTVCLLGVCLLLCPAPAGAQERVEIAFGRGFEGELPLEVPFLLIGDAPDGVHRIEFSYGPAPGEEPGYLPLAPGQTWVRTLGDEFAFEVWPLHHRKRYRFELRLPTSSSATAC